MNLNWKLLIENRLHGRELPQLPARVKIPRPPKCIAEFLKLVDQQATPLDRIAQLIETDSEIASNVLRIVNGSQLMLKERISSISRAIGILGLQRCKMLVMSAAIQSTLRTVCHGNGKLSELIFESQLRALFAKRVAELLGVNSDVSYASALLQDLAVPQLMSVYPELYSQPRGNIERMVEWEENGLGWDHSLFTASLLENWNFATEVIGCVAMHHEAQVIFSDAELCRTEVAAVALSGLLPGVLNQEPRGISLLLQFQNEVPEFDLLQIATDVDEDLSLSLGFSHQHVSLAERLSRLAIASLQQKRDDPSWVERTVGSYTLEERIGQGGMGVVYRARHSMLRRPAAVKMLKSSNLAPHAFERFEVEAHITSELSSPHTVQVYDFGITSEGNLYYVMEFLQGKSLAEIVQQHGPMSEGRIIHILCQVCGSLAEAHSNGLIHRDIKPENIALTVCGGAYDFAKVLDFGLVAVKDEIPELASSGKLYGTPAYLAPEAIQSPDLIDERTDIYAIGAVAYFCLTGKAMFSGNSVMDILHAQIHRSPQVPKGICSDEFTEFMMSCLEKSPERRPASIMDLIDLMGKSPQSNGWSFEKARRWWETQPSVTAELRTNAEVSTQIVHREHFAPTHLIQSHETS